jgi:hypothetical protein
MSCRTGWQSCAAGEVARPHNPTHPRGSVQQLGCRGVGWVGWGAHAAAARCSAWFTTWLHLPRLAPAGGGQRPRQQQLVSSTLTLQGVPAPRVQQAPGVSAALPQCSAVWLRQWPRALDGAGGTHPCIVQPGSSPWAGAGGLTIHVARMRRVLGSRPHGSPASAAAAAAHPCSCPRWAGANGGPPSWGLYSWRWPRWCA